MNVCIIIISVVITKGADPRTRRVKGLPNSIVSIFNKSAHLTIYIILAILLLLYRTCGVFVQQVLWFMDDLGNEFKVFNFMNVEETGIFQEFESQILVLLGIEHATVHEAREFMDDF